jgi:hypothetical protein
MKWDGQCLSGIQHTANENIWFAKYASPGITEGSDEFRKAIHDPLLFPSLSGKLANQDTKIKQNFRKRCK